MTPFITPEQNLVEAATTNRLAIRDDGAATKRPEFSSRFEDFAGAPFPAPPVEHATPTVAARRRLLTKRPAQTTLSMRGQGGVFIKDSTRAEETMQICTTWCTAARK